MFIAQTNIQLPPIPYRLQQQIKLLANEGPATLHKQSGAGIFECKHLTMGLYKWLRDNIVEPDYDVTKIMVQTIREGSFEPHIDGPSVTKLIRYYNLMYIIETGGDNVTTQFYASPPELVERAKSSDYRIQYGESPVIGSFEFKKDTWNLMNNQLFHSVEGITSTRIGLSISFYEPNMTNFLLKIIGQDSQNI